MKTDAKFDKSGRYRFTLLREWDQNGERLAFVMLNPSAADAVRNDPTINACLGLARHLGFGSMEVVNLFAYCCSDPVQLTRVKNPVGRHNDSYIVKACRSSRAVLLAWGNHGKLMKRQEEVMELLSFLPERYCLGVTKSGEPRHPLYVKRTTALKPYPGGW